MQILVIRHAIAAARDAFAKTGRPDSERPLTDRGRDRMRAGARGLATLVEEIDVLATSPYTRAAQTAEIVARAFRKRCPSPIAIPNLTPEGNFEDLIDWLGAEQPDTVAIVGHEPQLSGFVTWLLGAQRPSVLDFKKGAACLVGLPPGGTAGMGILAWALAPKHLRQLDAGT